MEDLLFNMNSNYSLLHIEGIIWLLDKGELGLGSFTPVGPSLQHLDIKNFTV